MFVKTDPQRSLLECEFLLPPEKRERLKKSWAEPFRQVVLPLIDEEVFRDAFCENNGRPNKSIRLLVCLHILKEWNDLTDEQVLDQLEYNLQWHYALGIESGTAHVCQKTLHNFRVMMMGNDRAKRVFVQVTRELAEADGLNLGRQRLDSTHVLSNIAVLTRLGQFEESEMLPDEELADTGYGSGANIVESAQRGVDLHAPVPDPDAPPPTEHFTAPVDGDFSPEAGTESAAGCASEPADIQDTPIDLAAFTFDATYHEVRQCPEGNAPERRQMAGNQVIATFSAEHCGSCPLSSRCPTRVLSNGERQLRRAPTSIATEVRQAEQQSPAFKERYKKRSGIEATNQELKGRHGLGNLRIRGKPRVELAVRLKSLALNVKRATQFHVFQMAQCAPCPC